MLTWWISTQVKWKHVYNLDGLGLGIGMSWTEGQTYITIRKPDMSGIWLRTVVVQTSIFQT